MQTLAGLINSPYRCIRLCQSHFSPHFPYETNLGITHRLGLGFGEIFPGSAESTRRIILLSIEERVFAKAEQCATKSGRLGDKQGVRGLQCSHGGRNPGTFHSVRLSLGTKRGVDLSEKTSNFVSKLYPCRDSDCFQVAGGPERREADQSSKSIYLLHTSVSLGSPCQRLSTIVPTVRKSHPGWAGG